MQYNASVFIGRFQPFHKGHLHNIKSALEISEKLILIIGSASRARSIKNPFTFDERKSMILSDLDNSGIDLHKIFIEPVVDYFYDEQSWVDDITQAVSLHMLAGDSVTIIGHDKDSSSYYLKIFPSWEFSPISNYAGLNATSLRNDLWQLKFHEINAYLIQNKDKTG
ncbi:MAG: bifunctional NMN adenylyltransferase/nudix hydrolase, partial [Francisellaceae bacterium]